MIIKIIELYVVDGEIVLGNELDGYGNPVVMRYNPLSFGVPTILMVSDDDSCVAS